MADPEGAFEGIPCPAALAPLLAGRDMLRSIKTVACARSQEGNSALLDTSGII